MQRLPIVGIHAHRALSTSKAASPVMCGNIRKRGMGQVTTGGAYLDAPRPAACSCPSATDVPQLPTQPQQHRTQQHTSDHSSSPVHFLQHTISTSVQKVLVTLTAATMLVGTPVLAAEAQAATLEQEGQVSVASSADEAVVLGSTLSPQPDVNSEENRLMTALVQLSHQYDHLLQTRPIATKIATGIVGTLLGDALAQLGTGGGKQYDVLRTLRLMLFTAVVGTPMVHYWFQFLDAVVFPDNPTALKAVFAKVLVDQSLMAPFGTALFFAGIKTLEGQPQHAIAAVKLQLPAALGANYLIWPLANVVNFALVPPAYRILYCNVVSIFWSAFLSSLANAPASAQDAPPRSTPEGAVSSAPASAPAFPQFSLAAALSLLEELRTRAWRQPVPLRDLPLAGQVAVLAAFPLLLAGQYLPPSPEPMVQSISQRLQTWTPGLQRRVGSIPARELPVAPQLVFTNAPVTPATFKAPPALTSLQRLPMSDASAEAVPSSIPVPARAMAPAAPSDNCSPACAPQATPSLGAAPSPNAVPVAGPPSPAPPTPAPADAVQSKQQAAVLVSAVDSQHIA